MRLWRDDAVAPRVATLAKQIAAPDQLARRAPVKRRDAFEICHEIYAAARELVDSRLPTTQLQSSSKFLWRPDLHPRLVEYVADFALAGERALGDSPDVRRGGRANRD